MEQVRTTRAFFGPEGNFKKDKIITVSAGRAKELADKGFVKPVTKTEAKQAEQTGDVVKPSKKTTK